MRSILAMLRADAGARRYFLAHAQSSIGTGASYVAILVLVWERSRSPWALTLVLLADYLPQTLLGPLFGALADRWPRRRCAVTGDIVRVVALGGIALSPGLAPTVAFALLAGAGTALFNPAILAGLPALVEEERLPAALSLQSALHNGGQILGPACAAALLAVASAESVLWADAATFALSASLLWGLRLDKAPSAAAGAGGNGQPAARRSLLAETRAGIAATMRLAEARTLVLCSTAAVLSLGMLNVGELLLARKLAGSSSGLAALTAAFGVGVVLGAMSGSRPADAAGLRHRYLAGLVLIAAGLVAAGLAPVLPVALCGFAMVGSGQGIAVVHERRLLQRLVPEGLLGRVFGIERSLVTAAFGVSYVLAGGLVQLVGPSALFAIAGAGVAAAALGAGAALLRPRTGAPAALPVAG